MSPRPPAKFRPKANAAVIGRPLLKPEPRTCRPGAARVSAWGSACSRTARSASLLPIAISRDEWVRAARRRIWDRRKSSPLRRSPDILTSRSHGDAAAVQPASRRPQNRGCDQLQDQHHSTVSRGDVGGIDLLSSGQFQYRRHLSRKVHLSG